MFPKFVYDARPRTNKNVNSLGRVHHTPPLSRDARHTWPVQIVRCAPVSDAIAK